MFEKLQTGEKSMMHQDSLKPAAIQFMLERLQGSARRSGYFLPAFFMVHFCVLLQCRPSILRTNYSYCSSYSI